MDISEKRIIGSLILLTGITFLSIALSTNQLEKIIELIKGIFEPAMVGIP